jgi:peptide-methionine (S)-S-oxide reductase
LILFLFKEFKNDIVTEVTKFENFYKSEDYHNNYFNDHTEESYCKFVVDPKVRKFLSKYKSVLKPEYKWYKYNYIYK